MSSEMANPLYYAGNDFPISWLNALERSLNAHTNSDGGGGCMDESARDARSVENEQ